MPAKRADILLKRKHFDAYKTARNLLLALTLLCQHVRLSKPMKLKYTRNVQTWRKKIHTAHRLLPQQRTFQNSPQHFPPEPPGIVTCTCVEGMRLHSPLSSQTLMVEGSGKQKHHSTGVCVAPNHGIARQEDEKNVTVQALSPSVPVCPTGLISGSNSARKESGRGIP